MYTCRIYSSLFLDWGRTISPKFFVTQVPLVFSGELMLHRCARWILSHLRCYGHSILLNSYLFRIGRIKISLCSACGHPTQDISYLILHCPAVDSLCRILFGNSLSFYDLLSSPWRVARSLGLHGLPQCPDPSGTGGLTTTTARLLQLTL